jgi:hypothetical protein
MPKAYLSLLYPKLLGYETFLKLYDDDAIMNKNLAKVTVNDRDFLLKIIHAFTQKSSEKYMKTMDPIPCK